MKVKWLSRLVGVAISVFVYQLHLGFVRGLALCVLLGGAMGFVVGIAIAVRDDVRHG